jgi:hypothetical protein
MFVRLDWIEIFFPYLFVMNHKHSPIWIVDVGVQINLMLMTQNINMLNNKD